MEPFDEEIPRRIDAVLAGFLTERAAGLTEVGPELVEVADCARRTVLGGGKRLRPRFAYWGWRAVRPATDADGAVVTAAAALELVHGCALVHDDLIDDSDRRRGAAPPHRRFAAAHRDRGWFGSSDAFGAAAALLVGDLLLSWSDTLFARAPVPAATRRVFDDMRQLAVAGQFLDVVLQARGGFDPADALRAARYKTGKYTVEGPLHLGATAGGAGPATLRALSDYALPLGEAFQLRDDVLGVFGDPDETGKPAGDDLREGKRTLLVSIAMSDADAAQARVLRDRLGRPDLTEADVSTLREVVVATGALAALERRIERRADEARAALDSPDLLPDAVKALDVLAVAATQRRC